MPVPAGRHTVDSAGLPEEGGQTRRRAPAQSRREPLGRLPALAAGCLVAAAWVLGGFWTSVQERSPHAPYGSPLARQGWIRSPEVGPRAFFRLSFGITAMPLTATLWVQGDQAVVAYVNGFALVPVPRLPPVTTVPKQVDMVDVLPALGAGQNIIGLEVANLGGQVPEFQARLELGLGSHRVVLGSAPRAWSSTTDVALTGELVPDSGSFSEPGFQAVDWQRAIRAPPTSGAPDLGAPSSEFTTPPLASPVYASAGAVLTVSDVVRVPSSWDQAWVRVAATAPYTLWLNGQPVGEGAGGDKGGFGAPTPFTRPASQIGHLVKLDAFDISSLISPGLLRISVMATAGGNVVPIVYVDGAITSGLSGATFGTGTGWWISGAGHYVNSLATAPFGSAFDVVAAGPVGASPHDYDSALVGNQRHFALQLLDSAYILLAMALVVVLGLLSRGSARAVLPVTLLGALPSLALVALWDSMRHLTGVLPPFPSTPMILGFTASVFALGMFAALTCMLVPVRTDTRAARPRHRRRRHPIPRGAPWVRVTGWLSSDWPRPGIVALTAVMIGALSYQVNWDPLWQDELDSVVAAKAIQQHILPIWPSGFEYWKSELYSSCLALLGLLSHNSITVFRLFSVALFAATVLLFGLIVAPMVMPGRRAVQFLATVMFAVGPMEGQFARDVRMYQLVQLLVLSFSVLFLRALKAPTARRIALAMGVLVCMYLAHEVSFAVLPLVPLALFWMHGWRWLQNWRWWVFGGMAALVVAVQVSLAVLTHPPIFGVDPSGGPLVGWPPSRSTSFRTSSSFHRATWAR